MTLKNSIKTKMIDEISNLAKTLQLKIRQYGESMGGHNEDAYISLAKRHFNYLQNLRQTNPLKYKKLIYFATIYPTMDIDKQEESTKHFFNDF